MTKIEDAKLEFPREWEFRVIIAEAARPLAEEGIANLLSGRSVAVSQGERSRKGSYGTIVIHMEDSNGNEVTFEKEFNTYVSGEGNGGYDPGFDPGIINPDDPGFDDPNGGGNGEKTDNKIVAFFKKLPFWAYIIAAAVVVAAIVIPIFAVRAHKKNKEFEEFDD